MFLLLILIASEALPTPTQFDWTTGGSYMALGEGGYTSVYPTFVGATNFSVKLTVDTINEIIAVETDNGGDQYVTPEGFYFYYPQVYPFCTYRDLGYEYYVNAYKQAVSQPYSSRHETYFGGLVPDPGSCNVTAASTIGVGLGDRVFSYSLEQILWNREFNITTKVNTGLKFVLWLPLHLDPNCTNATVTLPDACTEGTLVDYCSVFGAPPGVPLDIYI
jgi:hypothetical protein